LLVASRPSSSRTISPHPLGASAEWACPTATACLAHRSLRAACVPAAPAASRLSGLRATAALPMFPLLVDRVLATDVDAPHHEDVVGLHRLGSRLHRRVLGKRQEVARRKVEGLA